MSYNNISNQYINELNKCLIDIKRSILISTSTQHQNLINEFVQLLDSFKLMNASERKFDNIINQYEKELESIKNHTNSNLVNTNSNLNNQQPKKTNTIDILKNARETLISTEKVAEHTLENLNIQNEKVISISNKTNKVNTDINHSSKLLSKMSKWYHGLFK